MADIKQRISLDGADEVAGKLRKIGDTGQDAFKKLKEYTGGTGFGSDAHAEAIEGAREAGEKLKETLHTLHPIAESAGIELGNFATFARLAGAGLVPFGAALAGSVLVSLGKIGEQSQKTQSRLKALGAGEGGFEDLAKQAKALGTSTETIGPSMERLLQYRQKQLGQEKLRYGPAANIPSQKDLTGAFNALFAEGRRDLSSGDEIAKNVDQFLTDVTGNNSISAGAVDRLHSVLPHAADLVAKSVSDSFNPLQRFGNAPDLSAYLARTNSQLPLVDRFSGNVFGQIAKQAPRALDDAAAARGVMEAFEGLEASAKRLGEAMGGDSLGLTGLIDKLAHSIDGAAEHFDQIVHPRDYEPGGGKFIGPVSPAERAEHNKPDVLDLGKTLLTGESDKRFDDSNAMRVMKFLHDGPQALRKTPIEALQDMRDAAGRPDAIYQQQKPFLGETNRGAAVPVESPPPAVVPPSTVPGFFDPNPAYGWPVAPPQPTPPDHEQPIAPSQRLQPTEHSDAGSNALASLGQVFQQASADASQTSQAQTGVLQQILTAIAALVNKINPPNTRVDGDVDTIGVRGASGGYVALDTGGHVRGPGTSTSDSIDAKLSDGEYVVKASTVKKMGVDWMDRLNSGKFADGGEVTRTIASNEHEILYDPSTGGAYVDGVLRLPGDPLLNDPIIRQGIAQSMAAMNQKSPVKRHKSDFIGRFGYDPDTDDGSGYAEGGLVGMIAGFAGGGHVDYGSVLDHESPMRSGSSILSGAAKDLGPGSGKAESLHPVTINLHNGESIEGLRATPDGVLDLLHKAAISRSFKRTGDAPSWYK
ncbi:hypothetical protein [Bradyrhizobium viridifuturi]|uniref:hypothetical protein n=1 Tax=Bradyrhizobium viridifuturi TaxID=1654716 RepID=UPI00067F2D12|nr:hypothetical protein [Bradyrhizobium viridifuturi]